MSPPGAAPRAAQWLAWAAAACWLVSWFLPVVRGYFGYSAFAATLTGPFNNAWPIRGDAAAAQLLSALTNVVFVVIFLAWLQARTRKPVLHLKFAIACLVMNLYWLVEAVRGDELRALLSGYYVWLAAFVWLVALCAVNAVSARRTSRTPTDGRPA